MCLYGLMRSFRVNLRSVLLTGLAYVYNTMCLYSICFCVVANQRDGCFSTFTA